MMFFWQLVSLELWLQGLKKKVKELYFINRYSKNLENKIIKENYNIFITSNLIVNSKFKDLPNFYFLHDYIKILR